MAEQINVELKKTDVSPKAVERVYANAYVNDFGSIEGNLNYSQKIGKKWGATTLLHANGINNRVDQNKDNFYDIPLVYQVNGVNRWKYENNGWIVQFGVKALKDERRGGQYDLSMNNPAINPPAFRNKFNG
jgi:outer membrane receptor for ferrienterochelin and colicins